MCTVSANIESGTVVLHFNRDERRQRPEALPLALHESTGHVPYLAAIDPAGGGTWLALNAAGIAVGLLNFYPDEGESLCMPDPSLRESRGMLVTRLAHQPEMDAMQRHLAQQELRAFPPFHCFLIDSAGQGQVCSWDGKNRQLATIDRLPWFLTTSSFRPREVALARRRRFEESAHDAGSLAALHRDVGMAPDPYAFCMERPDARTVSLSQLRWNCREAEFRYRPIPENGATAPEQVRRLTLYPPPLAKR